MFFLRTKELVQPWPGLHPAHRPGEDLFIGKKGVGWHHGNKR